jgi:hypothetical protein
MMTMAQSLLAMLKADTALAALISTRIYRNRMPKTATLPNIVFQRISTVKEYTHSKTVIHYPRWQFTCWSATSDNADSIANALEDVINRNNMFVEGRTDGLENETDLNYVRVEVSYFADKE